MTYRVAIENHQAFLVLDEPMDTEPVLRSFYWPLRVNADRIKEGPATISRLGCGSIVHALAAAGIHPIIDIPFDGKIQATRIESRPVDPPKVRRNVEIRYNAGRWETYSKKDGWK